MAIILSSGISCALNSKCGKRKKEKKKQQGDERFAVVDLCVDPPGLFAGVLTDDGVKVVQVPVKGTQGSPEELVFLTSYNLIHNILSIHFFLLITIITERIRHIQFCVLYNIPAPLQLLLCVLKL